MGLFSGIVFFLDVFISGSGSLMSVTEALEKKIRLHGGIIKAKLGSDVTHVIWSFV